MSDIYQKSSTRDTPEVYLDIKKGELKIIGNSYPSNSLEFYKPIFDRFSEIVDEAEPSTIRVDFYFHYINTSSTKMVIKLLELLEKCQTNGKTCNITWSYDFDDYDILGIGEDIRNYISIPFELISVEY